MRTETVVITDDLTGEEGASTVWFSLQGRTFQVDLTEANEKKLLDLLTPYMNAGRRVGNTLLKRPVKHVKEERHDPAFIAAVRSWAKSQGYKLGDRGRIPRGVIEAYNHKVAR